MHQQIESSPTGLQWKEKEWAAQAAQAARQQAQGAILGGPIPVPDLSEISQQMNRLREASSILEQAVSDLWRRLEYVTRGPVEATVGGANKASPPLDSPHGRELFGAADRIYGIADSLNTMSAALRI